MAGGGQLLSLSQGASPALTPQKLTPQKVSIISTQFTSQKCWVNYRLPKSPSKPGYVLGMGLKQIMMDRDGFQKFQRC